MTVDRCGLLISTTSKISSLVRFSWLILEEARRLIREWQCRSIYSQACIHVILIWNVIDYTHGVPTQTFYRNFYFNNVPFRSNNFSSIIYCSIEEKMISNPTYRFFESMFCCWHMCKKLGKFHIYETTFWVNLFHVYCWFLNNHTLIHKFDTYKYRSDPPIIDET